MAYVTYPIYSLCNAWLLYIVFRKFGIVVIIEIFSVTSQSSFDIETLHGWRYNDIKHVVCHDCYFQNQTRVLHVLQHIGRIHPIQLAPLKPDESLIAKYIQATSWLIAKDIREHLQRFPDANQSKNITGKWRKLKL